MSPLRAYLACGRMSQLRRRNSRFRTARARASRYSVCSVDKFDALDVPPNDADLLELFYRCALDPEERQRILVTSLAKLLEFKD